MPISTINTNSIADDAVTVPKVTDQVLTHRNLIINGAMQVAQRGTSGTLVGGPGYVSLDRWRFYVDTSTTLTISQQSFSPGQTSVDKNLEYFMRFDWLGTGANQTKTMSQRIEGVNWGQGQPMTLSFYGLSQQADDVTIKVIQNFGSGGSASVIAEESVIDLTTSWNRYSLTFDMPSIAGKTVGTSPYIIVEFNFGPATLDSYFDITGVQMEVGDTATPFEHRSFGDELALCQRYLYSATNSDTGYIASFWQYDGNSNLNAFLKFPTTMRTEPTLVHNASNSGYFVGYGAGQGLSWTTLTLNSQTLDSAMIFNNQFNAYGSGTAGGLYVGSSAAYLWMDAEI